MKPFLLKKLWPVVAGLLSGFVIMMALEFLNSFFFPFPPGMDTNDLEAVRAFARTLPNTAYILVLLGWGFGSFAAGFVTTKLSGEKSYRLSLLVGIVLTGLGVLNNLMLIHPLWVNVFGLPLFLICTYIGFRTVNRLKQQ